jgi:hypothetical protein
MYSVAIDNNEIVIRRSFWVDTGNPRGMTELNAEAEGFQRNAFEEGIVPMLRIERPSVPQGIDKK